MKKALFIAVLLSGLVWHSQAYAAFKRPECIYIYQWSVKGVRLPDNVTYNTRYRIMFSDENIVPIFGKPINDWSLQNLKSARSVISKCYVRMSRGSEPDARTGMEMAMTYISRRIRSYPAHD